MKINKKITTRVGWVVLALAVAFSIAIIVIQSRKDTSHIDADGYEVDSEGILIAYPHESSVTVPATVDGIEVVGIADGLFSNDTMATTIVISDTITDLGTGFVGCSELMGIYIGAGVTELDQGMFEGDDKLSYISVDSKNAYYSSEGGCVYNALGTAMLIDPKNLSVSGDVSTDAGSGETDGATAITDALTVSSSDQGQAVISFNQPQPDKGYMIYRSTSEDGEYAPVAKVANGASSYTDMGLSSGVEYYYYAQEVAVLDDAVVNGMVTEKKSALIL